jgi:hypothetical protein
VKRLLAALLGLGIAAPAQASVNEQAALDHARSQGSIEALEAFAHQFPRTALMGALKAEYAKYECEDNLRRCGPNAPHEQGQHRGQYGG